MSSVVINALGKAIIVFGVILMFGAFYASFYTTAYGTNPYKEYAFILVILGIASLSAGLTLLYTTTKIPQIINNE